MESSNRLPSLPSWDNSLLRSTRASRRLRRGKSLSRLLSDYYSQLATKTGSSYFAGLRLGPTITRCEVCDQGKLFCQQYLFERLRRQHLLQHAGKMATVVQATHTSTQMSTEIQLLCTELEKSYPELYSSICRQLCVTLRTDECVRKLLLPLAAHMYSDTRALTWGRVIAAFSVAGAIATDCVQQGHPELLATVLDSFSAILNEHLADWIVSRGGWADLTRTFRCGRDTSAVWGLSAVGAVVGFLITLFATRNL